MPIFDKPFFHALIVGRFQPLHRGHCAMIDYATRIARDVTVLVGSAQEKRTERNPFSYEERKEMLEACFGDAIKIFPLPDAGIGNNELWGKHVLETVQEKTMSVPDLFVTGAESRREAWFPNGDISILSLSKFFDMSSSKSRDYLRSNQKKDWEDCTSPVLWYGYEKYRQIILESEGAKNTSSI